MLVRSGIIGLDLALLGGFREGLVLVYGEEGVGKSTLCLEISARATNSGMRVAWVDSEGGVWDEWIDRRGVNRERFHLKRGSKMEEILDEVYEWVKNEVYDVIVIDSVASLVPEAEMKSDAGEFAVGLGARIFNQFMRRIQSALIGKEILLLTTNQIRLAPGWQGPKEVLPYGKGQLYGANVIIALRRVGFVYSTKGGDKVKVGSHIQWEVEKSRYSPPFFKGTFTLYHRSHKGDKGKEYQSGDIDYDEQILYYGLLLGVMKELGGGWIELNGAGKVRWEEAREYVKQNEEEIFNRLLERLKEVL
jgi:recombination protein RecA